MARRECVIFSSLALLVLVGIAFEAYGLFWGWKCTVEYTQLEYAEGKQSDLLCKLCHKDLNTSTSNICDEVCGKDVARLSKIYETDCGKNKNAYVWVSVLIIFTLFLMFISCCIFWLLIGTAYDECKRYYRQHNRNDDGNNQEDYQRIDNTIPDDTIHIAD